jgi:LysR family transcriptional regulator, glycine cleavage system transcriptional activator
LTTLPLNALRAFEAVARLGSFRAAADTLFVTQSAVSHQIHNIEEWLGKPLFEREGNRTRLLPHGAELARNLAVSLTEIEAACDRARDSSLALVIAAIPSVAMCWLIPRLSRFRAAHPTIEVRIVYAMHGKDINFHDNHLAFIYAEGAPTGLLFESAFFLSGKSVPVCSPGVLQRLGRSPTNMSDFRNLGLLHDTNLIGWKTWLKELDCTTSKLSSTDTIEGTTFEDFNLLRAAALSGQGAALCPQSMIQPDLQSGGLVQISDRVLDEGSDYYLLSATKAAPQVMRQARLFRNWAMSESVSP